MGLLNAAERTLTEGAMGTPDCAGDKADGGDKDKDGDEEAKVYNVDTEDEKTDTADKVDKGDEEEDGDTEAEVDKVDNKEMDKEEREELDTVCLGPRNVIFFCFPCLLLLIDQAIRYG